MTRGARGHRVLAVMDAVDVDPERAITVFDLDGPSDRAAPDEPSGASTPAGCIDAIRAWNARHGCLPSEEEWAAASPEHPSARSVIKHFGSWKGGLAAAGSPVEPGHRPLQRTD